MLIIPLGIQNTARSPAENNKNHHPILPIFEAL